MISALSIRWRWIRYKWNRTQIAARLFGYTLPEKATEGPGLILIQIDGLSRHQLEKAMEAGRLPYLSRLLRRRHFALESFYSGVPSTTPAVQGEIFYGVKAVVPSFEFRDHRSGKMFRMFEAECADEIEKRLVDGGAEPLLEGAHVHSNIYRGGAAESHYCSADLSLDRMWRRLNPMKALLLGLIYFPKLIRGVCLALLEVLIAIGDVIGGTLIHGNLIDELKFVPARVGVCLSAREMIRFRILLDIARGVPLIQANFLGYDEQAHRRGPDSAFAHWTLKGIDRAIRDIHRAADGTPMVDYELMIHSDHGQERSTPYEELHGRTVGEAIHEVLSNVTELGTREQCAEKVPLSAMGPLGHLYLPDTSEEVDLGACSAALVKDAFLPLVFYWDKADNSLRAHNARGEWILPRDRAEVLGVDHPFLDEVTEDLILLSRHTDAGTILFSGWDPQAKPISFPRERGAHGGPGSEETRGFVLVPDRILRWHLAHHQSSGRWMRGTDLREVVRHYLGKEGTREEVVFPGPERVATEGLRVMTYNIHSCVGLDGRIRPERIARVINAYDPDLVAVQEVDAHRPRSGGYDQAKQIAEHLRMEHAFYAVFEERSEKYGIAVFSRFPFELVKTAHLTPAFPLRREARGAIWIRISRGPDEGPLHFINTHFGLTREERLRQVETLLGPDWIGGIPADEPVILCGDFNSRQQSPVWRQLQAKLNDVQLDLAGHRVRSTFPAPRALLRIDHVFVSRHFTVEQVEVPTTSTARIASDHFPLCARIRIKEEENR